MTDAGTTSREDEEDWQSIDESHDEGLETEDDGILIDPTLLELQANLVAALEYIGTTGDMDRSSSSTPSMLSSPVSRRETGDKGKIIMEETNKRTICMMLLSVNSLGPEPHNRKTALATTEWKQWEQAM